MKELVVSVAVFMVMSGSVFAQEESEKKEPLTISQALKLGEDKLTEYTGLSEVGQDEAAELYATARRLTTEQELGQKNLQLVLDLQSWREVISACRRSIYSLAYIINGGGTMYSHGERRDCSAVEDFLSALSKSLPFADAKGDEKATSVIDHTISVIRNLRAPRDQKSELSEEVKRAVEHWTELKHEIAEIPAEDSSKVVTFATDGVSGWLMNDDENGKKLEAFRAVLKR
jgi:hypothetical protein